MAYPEWKYYPAWRTRPDWVGEMVALVAARKKDIDSRTHKGPGKYRSSHEVQGILRPDLMELGFVVEDPEKRAATKIVRAVLFGQGAAMEKSFEIDGWRESDRIALEVEGSKAFESKNAVWDVIKFSLISDVEYGIVIVPLHYEPNKTVFTPPYKTIVRDLDSMYANRERFRIPLKGLLLVGF